MPKIHGTSTVWSCRLYRCNWTLSRDFDPVHKRKLSLSSDRRSALLSHLQPPANRLPIRAAPRVPAASSSSTRISYWKKKNDRLDFKFLFFFFVEIERKYIDERDKRENLQLVLSWRKYQIDSFKGIFIFAYPKYF